MRRVVRIAILLGLGAAAGCGEKGDAPKPPSLDSPNKDERLQGIEDRRKKWG